MRTLVESSSIAAAGLYAYGWVVASIFYGSFDIAPEEVGISFAYVIVRVFFVVAAIAIVISVLWTTLRRFGARAGSLTLPRSVAQRTVEPFVLIVLAVVAAATVGNWRDEWFLFVALGMGVMTAAVDLILIVRQRDDGFDADTAVRINMNAIARGLSWVVTVAVMVIFVVVLPRSIAESLTASVRSGGEVDLRPLPGISVIRVDRVRASTADRSPISDKLGSGSCVGLFGMAGGTVVLYSPEHDVIVRVSQERVTLESPCR